RLYLERWRREEGAAPDLGPTLYNLIDGVLRFLDIDRYSSHNTTQPKFLVDLMPEVYGSDSDALLRRRLNRKEIADDEKENLLRRVEEHGCIYLPQISAFYIREFKVAYAAEEATRFIHQACRGLPRSWTGAGPNAIPDEHAFYLSVLENALGYLGSRLIYPAQRALHEAALLAMYDETRESIEQEINAPFAEAIAMLNSVLSHRRAELSAAASDRLFSDLGIAEH